VKLSDKEKDQHRNFLSKNLDLFAWSPIDIPGADPSIICHRLSILPEAKLVKQKPRKMNVERLRALNDEVDRLLKVGFIREILYLDWLANPVLVKKKNGKWKVCIDFTDLNKACPKDSFPLPNIDRMVDATAGHELLSFMDTYSGYNQIKMHPENEDCLYHRSCHLLLHSYALRPKECQSHFPVDGQQSLQ